MAFSRITKRDLRTRVNFEINGKSNINSSKSKRRIDRNYDK